MKTFLYRNLGLHLDKISWTDCKSVFRETTNLVINFAAIYGIASFEPQEVHQEFNRPVVAQKPLFRLFTQILFPYVYVALHLAIIIGTYHHGPCLWAQLDKLISNKHESFCKISFVTFLKLQTLLHISGGFYLKDHVIRPFIKSNYTLLDFIWLISSYVLYAQVNFVWMVIYFTQCALLDKLEQIACKHSEIEIFTKINLLSRQSDQIQHRLSFLLLVTLLNQMLSATHATCFYIIFLEDTMPLNNFVYLLVSGAKLFYLVYLNLKVERKLTLIRCLLLQRHSHELHNRQSQSENSKWQFIRATEMKLQFDAFRLIIFSLGQLDRKFLLHAALFLLAYVVLVAQTQDMRV